MSNCFVLRAADVQSDFMETESISHSSLKKEKCWGTFGNVESGVIFVAAQQLKWKTFDCSVAHTYAYIKAERFLYGEFFLFLT